MILAMALPPEKRLNIEQLKRRTGASFRDMAKAASVSHPTIIGWLGGTQEPSDVQLASLMGYLHDRERELVDSKLIAPIKRKRLTKPVHPSTIDASRASFMEDETVRRLSYNEPESGNETWPRQVVDLCLSPEIEVGEFIIIERMEAEVGHAVEAFVGGKFIHRYLWRTGRTYVLKDGSGLLEDIAISLEDIRGVVSQRIEELPGEIRRTTEYRLGLRRRF